MEIAFALYASVSPLSSDPDVRDRIRKEWDIECQEQLARRAQWEREVEEHDRDIKEREAREEEERLRLNMFWNDPESHTCTMYGTRKYTARLVNIPGNYSRRVEACMATPIQIHGIEYNAKWCEDHVGLPILFFLRSTNVPHLGPKKRDRSLGSQPA
jgi:hypothetical protein